MMSFGLDVVGAFILLFVQWCLFSGAVKILFLSDLCQDNIYDNIFTNDIFYKAFAILTSLCDVMHLNGTTDQCNLDIVLHLLSVIKVNCAINYMQLK